MKKIFLSLVLVISFLFLSGFTTLAESVTITQTQEFPSAIIKADYNNVFQYKENANTYEYSLSYYINDKYFNRTILHDHEHFLITSHNIVLRKGLNRGTNSYQIAGITHEPSIESYRITIDVTLSKSFVNDNYASGLDGIIPFFRDYSALYVIYNIGVGSPDYEAGYEDGYSTGYNEGYRDGFNKGMTADYQDGYQDGLSAGYNEGYNEGYDEGYEDGKEEGLTIGYDIGYEAGHNDGYDEGYEEGHAIGYNSGYEAGRNDGYDEGYEEGHFAGYDEGYIDGFNEGLDTDAYNLGFEEGRYEGIIIGYNEGYDVGHRVGYEEGHEAGYKEGDEVGYNRGHRDGYRQGSNDMFLKDVSKWFGPMVLIVLIAGAYVAARNRRRDD